MNRADQGKPTQDLDKGRGWLERAEREFERESGALKRDRIIELAAAIGAGFVQLAAVGRLDELLQRDLTLQEQDELRQRRAAEEARPHDGEPLSLHTALAVGIDRGLRDLGAELSGCTPSMLTGHVIRELRDAGLHPSEVDRG